MSFAPKETKRCVFCGNTRATEVYSSALRQVFYIHKKCRDRENQVKSQLREVPRILDAEEVSDGDESGWAPLHQVKLPTGERE